MDLNLRLFYFLKIAILMQLPIANKASEILRPRGVAISKASLYSPDKDFVCFDGSLTIPFVFVNDDYCDCEDGSDEPGTAACPNGTFHCTNAGHRPQNIPSSRVNDGICDCCDTSDEFASQANCINNCNELGKAARVEAQKQAEVARVGYEMRMQLAKKGKELKQEKQEKIIQLEKDLAEADSIKKEKEDLKQAAEELENKALEKYRLAEDEERKAEQEREKKANEQEAFEHFSKIDSNQDGILQKEEIQGSILLDQNNDGEVSEDEIKLVLDVNEELSWDDFLVSGWPRIKHLLMKTSGMFKPPIEHEGLGQGTVEEVPLSDIEAEEIPDGAHYGRDENANEDEEEEGEEEEEEEEEREDGEEETQEAKPTEKPKYDEETELLIESAKKARLEFEEAEKVARDINREVDHLRESLEKDFGEDDEFAPLDGECFEYTDNEYVYKLCPFDQATQKPKVGGVETRLGAWNRWAGPEGRKYEAMLYDKGQSCWNGPQRSTFVKLLCGTEDAITSVSEPNRCEYYFEFVTPSICQQVDATEHDAHDEL